MDPATLAAADRAKIADDCADAADLLDRHGWNNHALWPGHALRKPWTGGSLCAVGALGLAIEPNHQAVEDWNVDGYYELVGGCLTGQAVADYLVEQGHKQYEVPDSTIFEWNDSRRDRDEVTTLLRDVATKFRPDETDGGQL